MPPTGRDVTAVISSQHREIVRLIQHVDDTTGTSCAQAFHRLRLMVAVHECAESLVIHPRAAMMAADGATVAAGRAAEERAAGDQIWDLEESMTGSPAFREQFADLAGAIRRHAEAEERHEWPLIEQIDNPGHAHAMLDLMTVVPDLVEAPDAPDRAQRFDQMMAWAERKLRRAAKSIQ